MYERTRFGTTPHSQKVVQDSDAYISASDGKIKRTGVRWLPLVARVCLHIGFCTFCVWQNGVVQGVEAPLHALSFLISTGEAMALATCGDGVSADHTLRRPFVRSDAIARFRPCMTSLACQSFGHGEG